MLGPERAAFLQHDEDNTTSSSEDVLLGGSFELTNLKPAPAPLEDSKPAAKRIVATATVARIPCCNGCGQDMDAEEGGCPGCDCWMHFRCGAPVGDEHDQFSTLRLCPDCEIGHNTQSHTGRRNQTSKTALRKRALKPDRLPTVVKALMSKTSPKPRETTDSNKQKSHDTIGLQGSNHPIYVVAFLTVCLGIILVLKALTEPHPSDAPIVPPKSTDPIALKKDFQDAWWLENRGDDFFTKLYIDDHTKLRMDGLRDVNELAGGIFSTMCGRHRFDPKKFPKVSIIVGPVYKGFPKNMVSMTVHSVIARTPVGMIAEILVLVGDIQNGSPTDTDLDWELQELQHLSSFVKVKKSEEFSGPVPARMDAVDRDVTGDILVFMDPYVEVWSSTWLQHLILPVMENPRTVAVPLIHQLSKSRTLEDKTDIQPYYSTMTNTFDIQRMKSRFSGEIQETPSTWEPYDTPFFDGPVFAVHRREFNKLGGADEGLARFGGENIEVSLKYWMCRGRVVMVPCTRVGHIPLSSFDIPPVPEGQAKILGVRSSGEYMYYGKKADAETIVTVRNFLRIMQVWAKGQSAQEEFYKAAFGSVDLPKDWQRFLNDAEDDDNDFDREEAARDKNKCENFDWFDRHVLMSIVGLHHPWSTMDKLPV